MDNKWNAVTESMPGIGRPVEVSSNGRTYKGVLILANDKASFVDIDSFVIHGVTHWRYTAGNGGH